MTEGAPPGGSGVRSEAIGVLSRAAVGATGAFAALVAVGELLGVLAFFLTRVYGLWSWAKIGLLTALLSLRSELLVTIHSTPLLPPEAGSRTLHVRFVPMLLTIAFLWLAARAGRRSVRSGSVRSPIAAASLAAAGAAVSVAILAAACSALVDLSFPGLGLGLQVDPASAAVWGGALAAAAAAAGAFLAEARDRAPAAALRGGLTAYGWALGLLAIGVLVIATLEPSVTRRYVDGVTGLGAGGGVLFASHVLSFPAQSALLLVPASGSCVEILSEGSIYRLCPWRLAASGPGGEALLPDRIPLSPWFWFLCMVPFVAALLGGRRAAIGVTGAGRAIGLGVAAGSLFALLTLLGAWLVAPRWFTTPVLVPDLIPLSHITVRLDWGRTMFAALAWGVVGGGLGAWLATRAYAEPELPRPTSA